MILRRADCGHYIPADVPPAGEHEGSGQPIYLCKGCAALARGERSQTTSTGPAITVKAARVQR